MSSVATKKTTQKQVSRYNRKWDIYLLNHMNDIEVELKELWETVNLIRKEVEELKQRLDKLDRRM